MNDANLLGFYYANGQSCVIVNYFESIDERELAWIFFFNILLKINFLTRFEMSLLKFKKLTIKKSKRKII